MTKRDEIVDAVPVHCIQSYYPTARSVDDPPPDGTWCWVNNGKDNVIFPARRASQAAGGWTNEDTWEDFASEIKFWMPIERPEPRRPS
ncbi:MAG: hypothetical protein ACRD9S_07735 [Pyrinomonadaceae bacterium]